MDGLFQKSILEISVTVHYNDCMKEKNCSSCEKTQAIDQFQKRKDSSDGYRGTCNSCRSIVNNKWRRKNVFRARAGRMRSYYKNREKEIERAKKLSKENPHWQKIAADNYKRKRPYYDPIRARVRNSRLNHIPFDEPKAIEDYLMSLPQECNYCGVGKEEYLVSTRNYRNDLTLQIDKIDPKLGYVVSNITLACSICNYIKGNWFDEQTMKEIGLKYVRNIW